MRKISGKSKAKYESNLLNTLADGKKRCVAPGLYMTVEFDHDTIEVMLDQKKGDINFKTVSSLQRKIERNGWVLSSMKRAIWFWEGTFV